MANTPARRATRIIDRIKVDDDRLESPTLHQPNVKDRKPPKVVKPSRTFQFISKGAKAASKATS